MTVLKLKMKWKRDKSCFWKGIEFIINTSTNPTNGAEGWNTDRQESGNSHYFAVHIDRTKRIRGKTF